VGPYDKKPQRLLTQLSDTEQNRLRLGSYCAGFEVLAWRCNPLADHLIEWIADYALKEDELRVDHTNMYIRLKEAAARVYRSEHYRQRGEIGEIVLHAICRDFFETIPLAPRVFYLTSSNDVVKSFDMVHVRYLKPDVFELWLGEAKLYRDGTDAVTAAIASVEAHIEQGFLKNEKLLLGPQISKWLPYYQEIRNLLSVQTSLDDLFKTAVFPICIACDSLATAAHTAFCDAYTEQVEAELMALAQKFVQSGLAQKIKVMLIYVPLGSKAELARAFDDRLKAFSL
jgi:hypothetical protein